MIPYQRRISYDYYSPLHFLFKWDIWIIVLSSIFFKTSDVYHYDDEKSKRIFPADKCIVSILKCAHIWKWFNGHMNNLVNCECFYSITKYFSL